MHLFALKAIKLFQLSLKKGHISTPTAQSPLHPFSLNNIIVTD